MSTKLVVYDGSLHIYRMVYQAKNMIDEGTSEDDHAKFAAMLCLKSLVSKLRQLLEPETVIFLFDKPGSTSYRKEINPEYKANRSRNDVVLKTKKLFLNILDQLGIYHLELDGLEADDIAYAMSRELNNPIEFVTHDWDWLSCITTDPYKTLYRPQDDREYSLFDFYEWYKPILDEFPVEEQDRLYSKIVLYKKAILGDSSDNIRGFSGIGDNRSNPIIVKLLKSKTFEDYLELEPDNKYEANFQAEFDRFKDNIKVLGYEHIPSRILEGKLNFFKPKFESKELDQNLTNIQKELNSKYILECHHYILSIIEDKVEPNPKLEWEWDLRN